MDREERGGSEQRWRITDGQDRSGWKKVKGIGNVVLNTWKLYWISESKMMNTRNSYYNKKEKWTNWTRTGRRQIGRELGGGKLGENHGWTSGQVARSCVQ